MPLSFAEKFSLTNKIAFITGAGGMLGRKHSAALLELGATVVMSDIDADGLDQAKVELSTKSPRCESRNNSNGRYSRGIGG